LEKSTCIDTFIENSTIKKNTEHLLPGDGQSYTISAYEYMELHKIEHKFFKCSQKEKFTGGKEKFTII